MKNIFLIAFTTLFVSSGSEKDTANCHASVTIINKSNKVIYFDGCSATPEIGYNPLQSGEYFKLIPEASKKDGLGRDRGCYEDLFSENNDKLYYLIFDEQVLLNNTFEDIKANDKVLKRFSFTLKQMQDVNWTIIYNGN